MTPLPEDPRSVTPSGISAGLMERANDAIWGWSVDRVKRKYDPYWWAVRFSYAAARCIYADRHKARS